MSVPSFTFPIEVAVLSTKVRDYTLTADDAARGRLARELGLESLDALRAQLSVVMVAGGVVEVTGRFEADLVQACVVTLKPVSAHLAETIDRRFVPEASAKEREREREAGKPDEEEDWVDPHADLPDPLTGGVIDLGEVVTEELSLALNPYPRAPGAAFPGASAGDAAGAEAGSTASSPFAALAALKVGKAAPRRLDHKAGAGPKARPGKGKPSR